MYKRQVLRIRNVIRKRIETDDIIEYFFALDSQLRQMAAQNVQPVFLVEKENIAKALGPVLEAEMIRRDQYLLIELMPPILDKRLRARSFQARTRVGMVHFDHEADWWPSYKHELLLFDKGRFADQVDASAWIGQYLADMDQTPTEEELEDWEYDEEYEEAEYDWGDADPVTGY